MESTTIRDAVEADLHELVSLHVKTWADTYPEVRNPPTYETRRRQWEQKFAARDDYWFCLVLENEAGKIMGFAQGNRYSHEDLPQFEGELNKIYLLREYHRRGLGKLLITEVARRFHSLGINSMVVFSEPSNPAGGFYQAMGGKQIPAKNGEFHGAYGWQDLNETLNPPSSSRA